MTGLDKLYAVWVTLTLREKAAVAVAWIACSVIASLINDVLWGGLR